MALLQKSLWVGAVLSLIFTAATAQILWSPRGVPARQDYTLNWSGSAVKNGAGVVYELSPESLRARLQDLLDHPETVARYRQEAIQRIREEYLWEVVTDKYEQALKAIARK